MTRLSSWVICSKWLSPPRGSPECSPNSSLHWSHSLLFFFEQSFRKVSVEGSTHYSLHLSPKWLLLHNSSLEGSANCALHISSSLLLGSKLHELLPCLTHTNPVRRTRPIMSGSFWGAFFGPKCVFFVVRLQLAEPAGNGGR